MESWLGRRIQFAAGGREIRLAEGFIVDGFCGGEKNELPVILNYHACFYHGCVKFYKINRDKLISSEYDESMDDRYVRTHRVINKILDSHKYVLKEIWWSDFLNEYRTNDSMRKLIDNLPLYKTVTKGSPLC